MPALGGRRPLDLLDEPGGFDRVAHTIQCSQALAAARDASEGPFRRRIVLCQEGMGLLPEHLPLLLQALRTKPGRSG